MTVSSRRIISRRRRHLAYNAMNAEIFTQDTAGLPAIVAGNVIRVSADPQRKVVRPDLRIGFVHPAVKALFATEAFEPDVNSLGKRSGHQVPLEYIIHTLSATYTEYTLVKITLPASKW